MLRDSSPEQFQAVCMTPESQAATLRAMRREARRLIQVFPLEALAIVMPALEHIAAVAGVVKPKTRRLRVVGGDGRRREPRVEVNGVGG